MRRAVWILPVSLSLVLTSTAAAQERPPAKQPKKEKKVWTNEDLEALRTRVPISEPGAAPPAPEAAAPADEARAAAPAQSYSKENDPAVYRQRATALRAELDRIDGEIRRLRQFKSNPSTGRTGIALGQDNISLTPENQIEQLERRRRQVLQELDDLEAEARRKGWPPGTVR
jgi:hypothetical protein